MAKTKYFWDPIEDNVVQSTTDAGGVTNYHTEPARYGQVISIDENSASRFLHCDALGSVLATTDSSQNTSDQWSYTAFGGVETQTVPTSGAQGFIGKYGYQTSVTTLVRRRHLSIGNTRWQSLDPEGDMVNRYSYVSNAPTALIDPSGLIAAKADSDIIGGTISECNFWYTLIGNVVQSKLTCAQFVAIYTGGHDFIPDDPKTIGLPPKHPWPPTSRLRKCGVTVVCRPDCPMDGTTMVTNFWTPCTICFRTTDSRYLREWIGLFVHESRHAYQYLDNKDCLCAIPKAVPSRPAKAYDPATMSCAMCQSWEKSAYEMQAIIYFPGDPAKQKIFVEKGICTSCRERCQHLPGFRARCAKVGIVIPNPNARRGNAIVPM